MHKMDLLKEMLIENNFNRPFEIYTNPRLANLYVNHRSDNVYLSFWFNDFTLQSRIILFPKISFVAMGGSITMIQSVSVCDARTHGNICDPKMIDNLKKVLLRFVSSKTDGWVSFARKVVRAEWLGLATVDEWVNNLETY